MNDKVTNRPQRHDPFNNKAAEKALWYIRDNAANAGIAKATSIYMEEYRKVVKSNCMKLSAGKSIAAQEVDAYSHPDYIAHLAVMRTAIEESELFRWKMVAAQATIESWRTHQANIRREQALG